LLTKIGQSNFDELNSGKREATTNEKTQADSCFSQLQKNQLVFLPPPAEQIPFLEEKSDLVNFTNVTQETVKVKDQAIGGQVIFKGKGLPNSTVTIYIYSDPIVVTTKTDENGEWVYELNYPLEGEKHTAYATVKSSGKYVKSSVFDFSVVAAEKNVQLELLKETTMATDIRAKFVTYAIIIIGCAFMFFIVIGYFVWSKRIAKLTVKEDDQNNLNSSNGESKTDTGSGPVN
jgi:hypothetical protein